MQAPEVIMRRGTDLAADYWALGILIFEMLTGDPPFKSTSGDPWDTFRKALTGRFFCPDFISQTGQSLIFALLQVWEQPCCMMMDALLLAFMSDRPHGSCIKGPEVTWQILNTGATSSKVSIVNAWTISRQALAEDMTLPPSQEARVGGGPPRTICHIKL